MVKIFSTRRLKQKLPHILTRWHRMRSYEKYNKAEIISYRRVSSTRKWHGYYVDYFCETEFLSSHRPVNLKRTPFWWARFSYCYDNITVNELRTKDTAAMIYIHRSSLFIMAQIWIITTIAVSSRHTVHFRIDSKNNKKMKLLYRNALCEWNFWLKNIEYLNIGIRHWVNTTLSI